MPLENGQQGTEKQHPDKFRHEIDEGAGKAAFSDAKAGGHTPASEETGMATREDINPAPEEPLGPEAAHNALYAEASLTKKIVVFALTTVVILIALGAIYAFWPHGQMPLPR